MHTDPIKNQIENIGNRRLLGCAVRFALIVVACVVILVLIAKRPDGKPLYGAAAMGMCGLLFGFATSMLTERFRRFLKIVFVVIPIAITIGLFVARTVFGYARDLPLFSVLTPLFFSTGFLIGGIRRARLPM